MVTLRASVARMASGETISAVRPFARTGIAKRRAPRRVPGNVRTTLCSSVGGTVRSTRSPSVHSSAKTAHVRAFARREPCDAQPTTEPYRSATPRARGRTPPRRATAAAMMGSAWPRPRVGQRPARMCVGPQRAASRHVARGYVSPAVPNATRQDHTPVKAAANGVRPRTARAKAPSVRAPPGSHTSQAAARTERPAAARYPPTRSVAQAVVAARGSRASLRTSPRAIPPQVVASRTGRPKPARCRQGSALRAPSLRPTRPPAPRAPAVGPLSQ